MTGSTNPTLLALGYGPHDRVVIFHMDDLGMAESTVSAYHALLDAGLLSAASVMMPCSWSPGAITAASSRPGSDVGVHLTLNSEWETCRWRPLLGSQAAELVDGEGFLHRRVENARRAGADVVARETRLQLEAALGAGLDVTHLDTHMGTAADPRYLPAIIELAITYGVPPLLPRFEAAAWEEAGLEAAAARQAAQLIHSLEGRGFPLVDHLRMLPLDTAENLVNLTLQMLRELPAGITHFILHPAIDTPELRGMCPDAPARIANLQAFTDPRLVQGVRDLKVQVTGYRPLRDLFRRSLGWA